MKWSVAHFLYDSHCVFLLCDASQLILKEGSEVVSSGLSCDVDSVLSTCESLLFLASGTHFEHCLYPRDEVLCYVVNWCQLKRWTVQVYDNKQS